MQRLVLFDLFETLVTEYLPDAPTGGTQKLVADSLGIPPDEYRTLWRDQKQRRHTEPTDAREIIEAICRASGARVDRTAIERVWRARLDDKRRPFEDVREDVLVMLNQLLDAGFRIGVISNCATEDVVGWAGSPLAELIPGPVFSWEAGLRKPDPAIYLVACSRYGVEPERTMFIGDGGEGELGGAREAGLWPLSADGFTDAWPASAVARHRLATAGVDALSSASRVARDVDEWRVRLCRGDGGTRRCLAGKTRSGVEEESG